MQVGVKLTVKNLESGYVNNWDTKKFSNYVKSKDKKNIILARDHGGPWQNNIEIENKYNFKDAMDSAKLSFERDIQNDFNIIHIDTSVDVHQNIDFKVLSNDFVNFIVFVSINLVN